MEKAIQIIRDRQSVLFKSYVDHKKAGHMIDAMACNLLIRELEAVVKELENVG